MALENHTSWQSEITESVDLQTGVVTLRAKRGGSVLTTAGESVERVRTSNYVPRAGDSFPDNTSLLMVDLNIAKGRGPLVVEWSADYFWQSPDFDGVSLQKPGVPKGWSLRRGWQKVSEPIDRDILGAAIITKTRESPDPPLTTEFSERVYTYSRSNAPYNPTLIDLYEDAVNSDIFYGHAAGSLKMEGITDEVVYQQNAQPTSNITLNIVKRQPPPEGPKYTWYKRWRAEGYYVTKFIVVNGVVGTTRARATDGYGEPVTRPVLHDRQQGFEITNPNDAEFYLTQVKRTLPFNTFFASL